MLSKSILLALVLSLTTATPVTYSGTGCAAVQIITARASTEAQGEGILSQLASNIQSTSTQTVARSSVVYPATLSNYASSSAQGTAALKQLLTQQVGKCPTQKIILLGYSQGAHVVGDTLAGGGGGALGATTAPVSSSVSSHVSAALIFGDPRHVSAETFQAGTAHNIGGLYPRPSSISLAPFAGVTSSWCDLNDNFCASGYDVNVHNTYLYRYLSAATTFAVNKIGG